MDNLRNSIVVYFSKFHPDQVLQNRVGMRTATIDFELFKSVALGMPQFSNKSHDELENIHSKVKNDWMYSPYDSDKQQSPLNLLLHFTKQLLIEKKSEPYVIYHHLLKWRSLTFELGEDVFSTVHFAYQDLIARRKRYNFSWRPVLFSDNNRLHEVLQQGVAENHSHLWASSLTFEISWMALMNQYELLADNINTFLAEQSLEGQYSVKFNESNSDYGILLKKAIAIRFILKLIQEYERNNLSYNDLRGFLFEQLGFSIDILFDKSNDFDSIEFLIHFPKILYLINQQRERSLKLTHNGVSQIFDYGVDDNLHPSNLSDCFYLSGERHILYHSFQFLFKNAGVIENCELVERLVHTYLLIKTSFRKELVLLNKRTGFGNFKEYQDRKFSFIPSNSIYSSIFLRISLNYNRRLMNIVSNEYRIGPMLSVESWCNTINDILKERMTIKRERNYVSNHEDSTKSNLIDRLGDNLKVKKKKKELYFVVHFFKRVDTRYLRQNQKRSFNIEMWQSSNPKDLELRNTVQHQAKVLVSFRETTPDLAKRIKGIDAASSELAARPEAFAQAFRFLKNHQLRDDNAFVKGLGDNSRLRITFHAGEDFFDVVDGMRYLDEAIRFLDMTHGDRFGHALAIGIDVESYYSLKQYKLMLSKQMLLDNLAWVLAKVRKFGLSKHLDEVYRLENLFKSLYSEVYLNSNVDSRLNNIHYQQYYDAWKLRGDDPLIYKELMTFISRDKDEYGVQSDLNDYFTKNINLTYWQRSGLNECNPKLKQIRSRYEISRLYFEYHFNHKVKNIGAEMKQFEVTKPYIRLVEDIQIAMMNYVAERNLGIETNPTSNYLIGSIQKYSEHPIFRWFNFGLKQDVEELQQSPQLSVSINTDDAGIFSTSLENEFALIAIALEKEKDDFGKPKYKPSMIYDWIDKVRQMGLEQSFNEKKR